MVDYVKVAATAKRLIEANGRQVTFNRLTQTPGDPAKPWNGNTGALTPLDLYGVFVPPNQVRIFGLSALGLASDIRELVEVSEQIGIIYPEGNDLRDYESITDGSPRWTVTGVQQLRPAETYLLAYVGVRR
jgi:hypothetical protein